MTPTFTNAQRLVRAGAVLEVRLSPGETAYMRAEGFERGAHGMPDLTGSEMRVTGNDGFEPVPCSRLRASIRDIVRVW